MSATLFKPDVKNYQPLAEILRPKVLEDVVGQEQLLSDDAPFARLIAQGHVPSLIFWGPPGCGKTTIAKLLASKTNSHFEIISAVTNGAADLKVIFAKAEERLAMGKRTILLVDEIHRFNRAQQDLFLPYVENGTITLIGATTENPSFEVNSALLSRCKVFVLKRLEGNDLLKLLERAEEYHQRKLPLSDEARDALCNIADGDGRYFLSVADDLFKLNLPDKLVDIEELSRLIQKRLPVYDKHQDSHYNLISALHKSLRGSDVDAALYWFCRMLDGGENPLYIARRLVRFAVEDIGLADPNALVQANAAKDAYDFLGSPEGELAIAQCVVYLATAPKSNANYVAYKAAALDAKNNGSLMPPTHILNAPTKMMKELGYGKDYQYDHDSKDGFSGQNYFPDNMPRKQYYKPFERGFEREIIKRLDYWKKLRESR